MPSRLTPTPPPLGEWKGKLSKLRRIIGPITYFNVLNVLCLYRHSLNESSVRPNGTPVMPILRSKKTQFLFSSFYFHFSAFLVSGKHQPEERKTLTGPIHIVFLPGPTQTSISFPPAGTPEATSWEQGQMARPHITLVRVGT